MQTSSAPPPVPDEALLARLNPTRPAEPTVPDAATPLGLLRNCCRAVSLVWQIDRTIAASQIFFAAFSAVIPVSVTYVSKLIVDEVVAGHALSRALGWVAAELGLVLALGMVQRVSLMTETLLRSQLGQRVNELVLEKALTLSLNEFEDASFYDRLTRARRDAGWRPLSLAKRLLGACQNGVSLALYGALLLRFQAWIGAALAAAAIPAFLAERSFSEGVFRLFRARSQDMRVQLYLESLLAREDNAKEIAVFRLGPMLLERYRAIFKRLFAEEHSLVMKRGAWGVALGGLSTVSFYGAYAWIVSRAVAHEITLGDMTMYLLIFKQSQSALGALLGAIGGVHEDNLYLSNLYEYLDHRTEPARGTATSGPDPHDGLRFEHVWFSYSGACAPALRDINLHIPPGSRLALVGENGAGKTTLIKLLARLYSPTHGRVCLDGRDLEQWDTQALRSRIGVIFQDFIRYQFRVGENIGAGDVDAFDDRARWAQAAKKGMADSFISKLPLGFDSQLGRWFDAGQELSIGQWQKVALARAFMSQKADILVLDEPTASMDAQAEAEVFQRFRELSEDRMGIVISHRFSTVRMADKIVVLSDGEIVEEGSHEALMVRNERYAKLFNSQAEGYR